MLLTKRWHVNTCHDWCYNHIPAQPDTNHFQGISDWLTHLSASPHCDWWRESFHWGVGIFARLLASRTNSQFCGSSFFNVSVRNCLWSVAFIDYFALTLRESALISLNIPQWALICPCIALTMISPRRDSPNPALQMLSVRPLLLVCTHNVIYAMWLGNLNGTLYVIRPNNNTCSSPERVGLPASSPVCLLCQQGIW